ncbi:cleft lip and palate transmembrane protein 1 homolog [Teleopsis dalmanni]|uniref:cleft lip and palate transmembrane protein 1 homolog n=1 Tax=Teleopsis dalmanni TaxID=139649 RepID=UPI0018CD4385|nr:cleft lip and palate transmembrane protein 1 homolog [Teleopsis dalmanni]XP_037957517.1 cleft lip and palate transmembrane protein 1 homolog [Teleopsis dalmanni]
MAEKDAQQPNAESVGGEAAPAVAGDEVAAGPNEQQQQQQQQQQRQPTKMESFFAMTKSFITRAIIIYFVSSFFRRPAPPTDPNNTKSLEPKISAWNYFENGQIYDLHIWLSTIENEINFKQGSNLIWLQKDLVYGDWKSGPKRDGIHHHSTKIKATPSIMNNGSIFMHAYVTRSGESPNPDDPNYAKNGMFGYQARMLNKFKRLRVNRNYNLLSSEEEKLAVELEVEKQKDQIISYWHPNITVNIVVDQTTWSAGSVPPPLDESVKFAEFGKVYLPIVFVNDYWNLQRDYFPINETTPELDLHITFQPLTFFKWQLYAAQQMKNKWAGNMFGDLISGGGMEASDDEQDSLKETLLDTNIYLLALTIGVSILHSVFEMLAFKNDIQFWNNRQTLEGLSVRSVFFGVFQSLIVFLYVLDNEANFMIRVSCFVGLGIEIWKIHKVVDINYNNAEKILGILPKISFKDKGSYSESQTKEYDNLAFKYLGWVCFPLLVGYFVYSLVYNEHKGWYSFVLNMLYGYLLTFGFIMMTPQLFINYKLKSVAHMPWRMMTYKCLNTFIDDIFAFVIKMPTMYRFGCFRDDIIFFVFLYQRWQYRVDLKRVNEFGFSGEMEQEASKKKLLNATASASAASGTATAAITENDASAAAASASDTVQDKPAEQKKTD